MCVQVPLQKNMFEETKYTSQTCISVRWAFTEIYVDGKKSVEAKLVARGCEKTELQETDPSAFSKESVQHAFMLFFWKEWKYNAIDVKNAIFKEKPIERDILVDSAAESTAPNMIWKLKTFVYGLNDASWTRYVQVIEQLISLGEMSCHYEPGLLFCHYRKSLHTLIINTPCWWSALEWKQFWEKRHSEVSWNTGDWQRNWNSI